MSGNNAAEPKEIKELIRPDNNRDENADRLMQAHKPPGVLEDVWEFTSPIAREDEKPFDDVLAAVENEYVDRMTGDFEAERDDSREEMPRNAYVRLADAHISVLLDEVEEAHSRLDEDEPLLHKKMFHVEQELRNRIETSRYR